MSAQKGFGPIGQIVALLMTTGAVLQANRLRRERKFREDDYDALMAIAQEGLAASSATDAQRALEDFKRKRSQVDSKWMETKHPDYQEMKTTSWGDVFKGREVVTEAKKERQKREEAELMAFLQRTAIPAYFGARL